MQLLLGRNADLADIRGVLRSTPPESSVPRWDSLDDAVRRVVIAHATGVLLVDGDQESGALHFEAGRVCFASTGGRPLDEPTEHVDPSDVAGIIDRVIAGLRANGSATTEFRPGPMPLDSGVALAADRWFDLGEPEPFAVYRLTRIA